MDSRDDRRDGGDACSRDTCLGNNTNGCRGQRRDGSRFCGPESAIAWAEHHGANELDREDFTPWVACGGRRSRHADDSVCRAMYSGGAGRRRQRATPLEGIAPDVRL